jgi:GNAT superfamily N-acetyltransferase
LDRGVVPDLDAILACDRAIRRRAAAETIPLPHGLVVRHDGLPDVHHLNTVLLDAAPTPSAAADAAAALVERWLRDRRHRQLLFDDAGAGERAAATLADRGWKRDRVVFMGFTGDPPAADGDDRAREISDAELGHLQRAVLADDASAAELRHGVVDQLVVAQRALRAGTPARGFGAGDGDGLQSTCTLFLSTDVQRRRVAMIDEVGTLRGHRERGLARAVVVAAVAAARAWGADLIAVPADADDWPQLMYARLGFAPLGRRVALTLSGREASGSVSGAV